jgi:hypothetical protein
MRSESWSILRPEGYSATRKLPAIIQLSIFWRDFSGDTRPARRVSIGSSPATQVGANEIYAPGRQ